ncbi:putative ABC transporter permease [Aminipila sp.]|uniref:putative ABC transporter permease n=1 Tax=Aminipila sp. TaxID=2060095 RepID=UPI001DD433A6|nr:hypothetical protein [Aminipila sp.]MBE6034009.1 hypothetical protein [Clostridiales bacterium]
MKNIGKLFILFVTGGAGYCLVELLFRHYTHMTMFAVGGVCFVLVGLINELFSFDMPMRWQMLIGGIIITAVEFISGCIINLWLDLNVWDYSDLPFNLLGQICLPFTFAWIVLSGAAIVLDDYLRYLWFNEEKPHYKL